MHVTILPLLAGLLLTGLPIFAALGLCVFFLLWWFTGVPLTIVPQRYFGGIDSFTLMAIPFFILAAEFMRAGGMAERLVSFSRVLVGWLPGGLAMAGVLACAFFGAISGSSPATLAAIGSIVIPVLIKSGYSVPFSVGLITTAGSLGIVIPPSITFVIYGAVTGTSIGRLFAAGLLPALMVVSMLIVYCYIKARREGFEWSSPPPLREIAMAARKAAWGLGLPVIILGGIYSGVFTPTESAAVAAVYGFVVGAFIYRQLDVPATMAALRTAGLLSATLLLITASASAFSWLLASQGIPGMLSREIIGWSDEPWVILLLFNVILLIAGCFLDGASALIILAPLMVDVVQQIGIDPVQFGVIAAMNVEIGMMTPPVGLNLFVAVSITGMGILQVARAVIPTVLIMTVGLMLVSYIPWISMALPNYLY